MFLCYFALLVAKGSSEVDVKGRHGSLFLLLSNQYFFFISNLTYRIYSPGLLCVVGADHRFRRTAGPRPCSFARGFPQTATGLQQIASISQIPPLPKIIVLFVVLDFSPPTAKTEWYWWKMIPLMLLCCSWFQGWHLQSEPNVFSGSFTWTFCILLWQRWRTKNMLVSECFSRKYIKPEPFLIILSHVLDLSFWSKSVRCDPFLSF